MFVLDQNRYYWYYIINLYYQHSKICCSFKQFCAMIVCTQITSTMLNKVTKIIFQITEIFHKTLKHQIILERGRIAWGTRQLLQGWSTQFDWICFKQWDNALKNIGHIMSMVLDTRNLFLEVTSGCGLHIWLIMGLYYKIR